MKNKKFNLTSPYLTAKARVVSKQAFWFGKLKRSAQRLFCVFLPYSRVIWACTFDKYNDDCPMKGVIGDYRYKKLL